MKNILTLFFWCLLSSSCFMEPTTEELILQECITLSALIKQLPEEGVITARARIETITKSAQSPEELYQELSQFRLQLTTSNSARFFSAGTQYEQQAESLSGVWQALLWCSGASALFLCITAIQDADAQKLMLSNNKAHRSIEQNQQLIMQAATQTVCMANALNNRGTT